MPTSVAINRTPGKRGDFGNATASSEVGVAMGSFLGFPDVFSWVPDAATWRVRHRRSLGGRRLRSIGRAGGGAVKVEPLHRHGGTGAGHRLLHALLDHLLAQVVARLLE